MGGWWHLHTYRAWCGIMGQFFTKLYKFAKAFLSLVHSQSLLFTAIAMCIQIFQQPFSPAMQPPEGHTHWHRAGTPYCTGLLVPATVVRQSFSLVSDSLCPPRAPRFSERSVVRKSSKKRIFQLAVYEEHNECHCQEQKEKQDDVSHQVWLIYFPFF